MTQIQSDHFTKALYMLLDETFDNVNGYYLDQSNSLFETLATVSAAEASQPVGGKCATLAAQVKHAGFYLDVFERSVRTGVDESVDWDEIWFTTLEVTSSEWEAIKKDLRASYDRTKAVIDAIPAWTNEEDVANTIAVVAHTAYHLGEIRQALCTI